MNPIVGQFIYKFVFSSYIKNGNLFGILRNINYWNVNANAKYKKLAQGYFSPKKSWLTIGTFRLFSFLSLKNSKVDKNNTQYTVNDALFYQLTDFQNIHFHFLHSYKTK